MEAGSYIFDTPGFSSLEPGDMGKEELEIQFSGNSEGMEGSCRFQGCVHMMEPGCAVKAAVSDGFISRERYDSYALLFRELHEREKRRYS